MDHPEGIFKKLQALEESEVSRADQVILEFCYDFVKREAENRQRQEVMFTAVLQALGRRLGIEESELEHIYMSTNRYIIEHWGEISQRLDQESEFARIISGILKDREDGQNGGAAISEGN